LRILIVQHGSKAVGTGIGAAQISQQGKQKAAAYFWEGWWSFFVFSYKIYTHIYIPLSLEEETQILIDMN